MNCKMFGHQLIVCIYEFIRFWVSGYNDVWLDYVITTERRLDPGVTFYKVSQSGQVGILLERGDILHSAKGPLSGPEVSVFWESILQKLLAHLLKSAA